MSELWFENVKTGKRYRVLALDKSTNEVTLQGELGKFTEPYTKERFERLGYRLVKGESNGEGERPQA